MKAVRQMTGKNKRDLFRPDSKLLTLWHEASKGRREIIITAVAGLIAGIFIFFMLLR